MTHTMVKFSLGVLLSIGVSVSVASAQNNPSGGTTEVRTQHTAQLSGPDQVREASEIINRMTATRRRVTELLDRARQVRDIIKVNCLNDKLTRIDVALRSAQTHQDLLQTAVSIDNNGQRNHEFQLMTILRSHSESFEAEARQCIGEDTGTFDRDTRVTWLVDSNIAEQDTTSLQPDMLLPERPLVTSPVL